MRERPQHMDTGALKRERRVRCKSKNTTSLPSTHLIHFLQYHCVSRIETFPHIAFLFERLQLESKEECEPNNQNSQAWRLRAGVIYSVFYG